MHENLYSLLRFGSDPTIHLQDSTECTTLCGAGEGAVAVPLLPIPTLLEYAPFEIGILAVTKRLDGGVICESCATVIDGIVDLEDDLIEMEYGHTA
jgi:hypothetical protein